MYFKVYNFKTEYFISALWFINLHIISEYPSFVMLLHGDGHKSGRNMQKATVFII